MLRLSAEVRPKPGHGRCQTLGLAWDASTPSLSPTRRRPSQTLGLAWDDSTPSLSPPHGRQTLGSAWADSTPSLSPPHTPQTLGSAWADSTPSLSSTRKRLPKPFGICCDPICMIQMKNLSQPLRLTRVILTNLDKLCLCLYVCSCRKNRLLVRFQSPIFRETQIFFSVWESTIVHET